MSGTTIFDVTQTNTSMYEMENKRDFVKTNPVAFSDVLSQSSNQNTTEQGVDNQSSDYARDDTKPVADAYDRYQYKDNKVEEEQPTTISEKINSAKDEIDSFEKNVVFLVAQQLEIEPAEVNKVLEELGMSAFDLMNPQNLAQVVIQLTDVNDRMELLLDGDFQNLLVSVGEAGSELMNELHLQVGEMDELVSQMTILEQPVEFEEALTQENAIPAEKPVIEQEEALTNEKAEQTSDFGVVVEYSEEMKNQNGTMSENHSGKSKEDNLLEPSVMQPNMQEKSFTQQVETVGEAGTTQMRYSDTVDAMDLVRQVAEQAKVTISSEVTTMEMQLNPENLGRIYLQVSAKEGSVNAQIAAQNEAVKEALEMQLAALREQLNQAGIKVDEIEVTVAAHEFEKNLEQNQGQNQSEQSAEQNNRNTNRRSIRMDSLDELSNLMTEEEQLVAQIMKDNGNSVDFTA